MLKIIEFPSDKLRIGEAAVEEPESLEEEAVLEEPESPKEDATAEKSDPGFISSRAQEQLYNG